MNNLNNRNLSPSFKGLEKYNTDDLFANLPTPAYVLDEAMLKRNGEILKGVQDRTGCKILLAQKAFSNFNMYGILGKYLAGTEASGLYEARLGAEEMPNGEVHVFCGAYKDDEFVTPLVTQISWTNHLLILSGCKTDEEREFYIRLCIKEIILNVSWRDS